MRQVTQAPTAVTPTAEVRPPHPEVPSLGEALDAITEEQEEEDHLIDDVTMQGTRTKSSGAQIKEYKTLHATLAEPHVMLMIKEGSPFVQSVHSVLMYGTTRRAKDPYTGKYLVAVGERNSEGQCTFVKTADSHWAWVEVNMLANYGGMGKFFDRRGNRLKTFNTDRKATGDKRWMPHLPMVPSHVGKRVIKEDLTTWEVVKLLRRMKRDAPQELTELINPALTWTLQASCNNAMRGRRMDLILMPLMRVTSSAQKQM
jgi:hypothetical protein